MKQMQNIFVLFIFFIISCNSKQQKSVNAQDTTNKKRVLLDSFDSNSLIACDSSKMALDFYSHFIDFKKAIYSDKIAIRKDYRISEEVFLGLFFGTKIACFIKVTDKERFIIYDFYYNEKKSEEVLLNIIAHNRRKNNHFHDFFKRGLIVANDIEKDKLTMIVFNPFTDPKSVKFVDSYFEKNKNDFDNVFRIIGLGKVKEFVQ